MEARFLRENMAKKKNRNKNKEKSAAKTKKYPSMRGKSAPEYLLFGFFVSCALLFSFLSWRGAKQVSTSFLMTDTSKSRSDFQKKINDLVDGYPIEKMSPYISRKNKKVASFLVAIAKKESDWGRHAPKKDGQECFNFWGYRGPENPTESGYSCFDSPQQAVSVVGGRINELVAQKIDTPKEMVMWKCGATNCARSDRGAAKWIWDVGVYYKKIYPQAKKQKDIVALSH